MFLFSEKTGTPNTSHPKGRHFFYIFLAARINNFFEIFESIFAILFGKYLTHKSGKFAAFYDRIAESEELEINDFSNYFSFGGLSFRNKRPLANISLIS